MKTLKTELNETKNQISDLHNATKQQESQAQSMNDLLTKNSNNNLKMMLKIQEGQDRIMMKIQEGAAVKDVPIESRELAKNDSMFKIFVSWSIPGGIFVSENRRKLPVYESNTIRQIKLRINSLAGIDIGSFSSYCDGRLFSKLLFKIKFAFQIKFSKTTTLSLTTTFRTTIRVFS